MGYGNSEEVYETICIMKCPNDKTELVLKSQENTFGYSCPKCQGVFLKSKGVDAFKYNFGTDILEKSLENIQSKSSNCSCANCSELMVSTGVDDMSILICKKCKSAFFEKGQLTHFKDKYIGVTNQEYLSHQFLPWPLMAIYSVYKYFTQSEDSNSKLYYGWILIFSITIFILWLVLEK
jgi:Zn-finger nucleic acid-binding protein